MNLREISVSLFYLYCWLFLFPLREMQTFSKRSERLCASLGEGHSFIALRFGTCMKLSDGFSRLLPTAGTIIACFYFLSLALKSIHLGIAYAIWAALGLVLTNILSVIFFKQPFDWASA